VRLLAAVAVLLGATLVQLTLAGQVVLLGAVPNLVLLAIVAWTWLRGPRSGLLWALVGGLLLDLAGFGPLGVHALAMLAAAYAAGWAGRALDGRLWLVAPAAALATACYGLVILGAADTVGHSPLQAADAAPLVAGASLYDAALAPLAVLLLARLDRRLPLVAA